MNGVEDPILMAFLDGELDPFERARIEQALTADAGLRERLAGFYGPSARLDLVEVRPHGVCARIVFEPPAPGAS